MVCLGQRARSEMQKLRECSDAEIAALKKQLKEETGQLRDERDQAIADLEPVREKLKVAENLLVERSVECMAAKEAKKYVERRWEKIRRFYGDKSIQEVLASEDAADLLADAKEEIPF